MRANLKLLKNFRLISFVLLLHVPACAWEENPEIGELFRQAKVKGTFVLYDVAEKKFVGYNRDRAETRYIPASTFKIANTLIGLSSGAVGSVDDILPYKGSANPFMAEWGHDMGLRRAIAISNVPIYQELARRIGLKRMREGVAALRYGNRKVGNAVDRFWLDGPLMISAIEQAQFLAGLAQDALPVPREIQKSVREIVRLETRTDWRLYGKTGWQNAPGPGIGWWVGWIVKKGRVYVFALNIDITDSSVAGERVRLGKASLECLGLTGND